MIEEDADNGDYYQAVSHRISNKNILITSGLCVCVCVSVCLSLSGSFNNFKSCPVGLPEKHPALFCKLKLHR